MAASFRTKTSSRATRPFRRPRSSSCTCSIGIRGGRTRKCPLADARGSELPDLNRPFGGFGGRDLEPAVRGRRVHGEAVLPKRDLQLEGLSPGNGERSERQPDFEDLAESGL